MVERFNIPVFNTVSDKTLSLFNQLKYYIDEDLFFYGSILRKDYIDGKSDIDISIFSENEYSTIKKLQHFLNADRREFRKIIWKLDGKIIIGYKIKCDKYLGIKCEISVYNEVFKKYIMKEHFERPLSWSWSVHFLLKVVKFLHYNLSFIDSKTYSYLKRKIMNANIESEFLVL